ncbi:MAG UNVERIFIED_CONTAM: hypothetical protein LVR18_24875 [Planctomycetaceae bacterium]
MTAPQIRRIGESRRWADIVIHQGIARWVEVASDLSAPAATQIQQVLAQIDETLATNRQQPTVTAANHHSPCRPRRRRRTEPAVGPVGPARTRSRPSLRSVRHWQMAAKWK